MGARMMNEASIRMRHSDSIFPHVLVRRAYVLEKSAAVVAHTVFVSLFPRAVLIYKCVNKLRSRLIRTRGIHRESYEIIIKIMDPLILLEVQRG